MSALRNSGVGVTEIVETLSRTSVREFYATVSIFILVLLVLLLYFTPTTATTTNEDDYCDNDYICADYLASKASPLLSRLGFRAILEWAKDFKMMPVRHGLGLCGAQEPSVLQCLAFRG